MEIAKPMIDVDILRLITVARQFGHLPAQQLGGGHAHALGHQPRPTSLVAQ